MISFRLSWTPRAWFCLFTILCFPFRWVPSKLIASFESFASRTRGSTARSGWDRWVKFLWHNHLPIDNDEVSLCMLNGVEVFQGFRLSDGALLPVVQECRKHCCWIAFAWCNPTRKVRSSHAAKELSILDMTDLMQLGPATGTSNSTHRAVDGPWELLFKKY